MTFGGLIAILISFIAIGLLISLRNKELWRWYEDYRTFLNVKEEEIMSFDNPLLLIGSVLFLFAFQSLVPLYPTSTVCFIGGAVLPFYISLPLNVIGVSIELIIKYYWGKKFKAKVSWKLIGISDYVTRQLRSDDIRSPILLFLLRLIPFIPINAVSSIYGSKETNIKQFYVISIIALIPRIASFTFVGRNIFDPFSSSFLLPVAIICFISGAASLSVNGVWVAVERIIKKHREDNKYAND